MKIEFTKMHGAGNDFVMIDDRAGSFPVENQSLIRAIAARGTGIGAEGVILVQPSMRGDFRMRFFNPDGGEAEMCGNGARCIAKFARKIWAVDKDVMSFETLAGEIKAEILSATSVRVTLPEPTDFRGDFVNTGVPHKIVVVDDLENTDVVNLGRSIRYSEEFAPRGTNVDFIHIDSPQELSIRTYERGVEDETGACGTGSTAAALIGIAKYGMKAPVKVSTQMGYRLEISASYDDGGFSGVTLTGPVSEVFSGIIDTNTLDFREK